MIITAARDLDQERQMAVVVENILQVAPKLTKTKPAVNLAKYLVERQF